MVMKSNFILLLTETLPSYAIALIIGGAVIAASVIVFVSFLLFKRRKNTVVDDSSWLLALGGKENITFVDAIGSRINLSLKDKEIIDREKLKELGVNSVLTMSNKVTLVVTDHAQEIADSIRSSINN